MWLLPVFSQLSSLAVRLFYRLEAAGGRVPPSGPALLVANHPNSLLDPAMVVAVARRPVRFLGKAPLFEDARIGWLVKAAGSIPVYRRVDDPAAMGRNEDAFRAVHRALAGGAAVGIFPEGVSHSAPSLAPLKTGAARMALGGAALLGRDFPVVPVGLTHRDKDTFRSAALAVVGEPVEWADLAGRGPDDAEAVQELTRRIAAALHEVTVNLERWEDAPLVEAAEAVYAAELPVEPGPAARVARLRAAAEGLARLRAEEREAWDRVAREVAQHARVLRVLGLHPRELRAAPRTLAAAEWTVRQAAFFLLGAPLAALGVLAYWLPYRLTGVAEARARPPEDIRATYKALFGGALHVVWTLLLAGVAAWRGGLVAGAAVLVALPLAGVAALHVLERWGRSVGEARRFFLRLRRRETLDELRARQRALAGRLHALWEEVRA
ncbi:MAG TPA: 1-acyl-sn-glycerol-3-phosphate acyltransferase [Longimicrobiaceae bacterium]|nr:1-acyl-sn-glycerol-3-phosphate acyltransferase [Longimicrobiaceae bacterium]